jgi:broad specificity phosphatase PhoE
LIQQENTLVVARHGLTAWARDAKHTSTTDIPLLPEGEEEALLLGKKLHHKSFSLVLSSPRQRAVRTAELAGYENVEIDDDLCEWNYGDDEGAHSDNIRASRPGWDMWRDGFAGSSETLDQVVARADRIVARAVTAPGDVLAFAHGHYLRILASRWIEEPGEFAKRLILDPATICVLGWKDHRRVIVEWNNHVAQ